MRIVFAVWLSAALLHGQIPGEIAAWQHPNGEISQAPKSSCASLRAMTGFEFSVVSAALVAASGTTAEFCRVVALIQPEVRFEVALPTAWQGRLLMTGNGGYAGEDLENRNYASARDSIVTAGFVHTMTNTGHDAAGEPLGAFAVNPQKLVDYAIRAVHVTAITAKRLAAAYYGVPPKRAYFIGCSTGGRQALMEAQRFPDDFDGISAGAPVLDPVGTIVKYASMLQAMAKVPLSLEKLKLAGSVIYSRCDEKDGVKDGVIEDPRNCGFDPAADLPKCVPGQAEECFTAGEISVLQSLYADQVVGGKRVFPGWPVGAEATGANGRIGWSGWLVGESEPSTFETFGNAFFRYLAFPKKDPVLQVARIDLPAVYPQLNPIRQMLNATDTDLSLFRDRGGKLLMWFGWADPALNPMMGVEYYESVMRKMGPKTDDFFRLFMMPGVFHCSGGPGCDAAPRLAALIDWVERGPAPNQMTASRVVAGKVVRTRPICAFPQASKYKGAGSTDEAGNFVCALPDSK